MFDRLRLKLYSLWVTVFHQNPTELPIISHMLCANQLIQTEETAELLNSSTPPKVRTSLTISSRQKQSRLHHLDESIAIVGGWTAVYKQLYHLSRLFQAVSHLCLWVDGSKAAAFCLFVARRTRLRAKNGGFSCYLCYEFILNQRVQLCLQSIMSQLKEMHYFHFSSFLI